MGYVVEEKANGERRKYPRITYVKEMDKVVRITRCNDRKPFEIRVVKKIVVEEKPDRMGFRIEPLTELMYFEPYILKDELTDISRAIQVKVEFINWKWHEENLPYIYVPANWSDETVLEFVHKLWELGKWMVKAEVWELRRQERKRRQVARAETKK